MTILAGSSATDVGLDLFRDNSRRFLLKEVIPHYDSWERAGTTPPELWRNLGDAGLLCVDMPVEHGGHGAPFEYSQAILEKAARLGFGALVSNLAVHSDIVAP